MHKEPSPETTSLPNWKTSTLGGKQFWTDHAWRDGWRVQRNAVTGHWRLLDQNDIRQAWGTRPACDAALDANVPNTPASTRRYFILLHGLIRSSASMEPIESALKGAFDCEVASFSYASTRASITDHAAAFREFVSSLPPNIELKIVGHSMGNIVVRHAIGDWQRAGDQATLSRIKSFVMLGPPNQGAEIARQLSKLGVFELVVGKAGMELGPEWQNFEKRLAMPHCPFGIVAGRLSEKLPRNPLVGDAGDFVVGIEESKLYGAADFLEVPVLHSLLMNNTTVQEAVVRFAKTQRF